ncbi:MULTISPECIES: class I adenylate-forming enzyme family protein [Mycobacterium]|uniref:Acyl-CoA synthetase n=1 Tax=Mycobacterium kiyosense TaxID=2871094 RepID=A0A9P3UZ77_9MYCO|nr:MULTISPECIES: AMP-binding protein [Mycobacterium]BDE14773.1 acyl-CoA synthetase [Mycobacterium sp. 20KCMC460]GLB84237.1 acyl-CoA synthetase [Mycobacterium kiyosense]GLB93135.1 acyl-CoA synthetase [Mycobacterium kiyosense]GLB96763.1 acyl-CoA synthetase [Mycobacterium kiyosense]GLC01423.1 acyl-CoA synthetase [Mycobacterium kiyosense]
MATLAGVLATNAGRCPARPALIFGDRKLSYREVDAKVNQTARALATTGLRKGDRMVLMSANSDSFYLASYAAWRLGALVVPANPAATAAELQYLLDDSQAAVLVFGPTAAEAAGRCAAAPSLVYPPIALDPELARLAAAQPDTAPDVEVSESDDAAILYTSGTTGRPKGALFDHHRVLWVGLNAAAVLGLRDGDRVLHVAPMYHAADLTILVVGGTQLGATHVILPAFSPDAVLDALEKHSVNAFFGVPTMYQLLLRHPELATRDLSAWRVGLFGAAPMPASAVQEALEALPHLELIQACGQTEGGPGGIYSSAQEVRERPDASGRHALFNTEARIVDPDGNDVGPGGTGELVLRGETVMKGYWRNPEATAETIRDGWLHTGDVATIDADGYITLVDRLKDMIISGGRNIYSVEVENELAAHPAIADIAVVSREHPDYGETVVAVITPHPGHSLTLEELRSFGAERLSAYKLPRELIVRDIPRNPSGKILKHLLRADLTATDRAAATTG